MTPAGVHRDPAACFAAVMAAAGPFETAPHLAVALSGGADSTALVLMARAWAIARAGTVTAVTVDHGLRSNSAAEAAAVSAWSAARGIAHVTLRWHGAKPARAIQEKARGARYALLEAWCREAGVLHLLLGHHADDQRETIAMRAAKRSGEDGLAGMALIVERTDIRLVRPLLGVAGAALRHWLLERGETWVEDPSNRDPRFLRSRLRVAGADPVPMARWPASRAAAEAWRADWLGRHAAIHPEGWTSFHRDAFAAVPEDAAVGLLRAGVATVSGAEHPPRRPALVATARWARQAAAGERCSFHGCILVLDAGHLAILRNPAACRPVPFERSECCFDRRFRVRSGTTGAASGRSLVALGEALPGTRSARRAPSLTAGASLPAARELDGSIGVLHVLCGRRSLALVSVDRIDVSFRPLRPLAGAAFAGPETAKLSSTPESLVGAPRSQPRLPERVVPP